MTQNYPTIFKWYDITTLSLLSNYMGMRPVYEPVTNLTSTINTISTAGAGPATSQTLIDFQAYMTSNDPAGIRGNIFFIPQSQWQEIDILIDDIQNLDLTFVMRSRTGESYPYYIPPNASVQLKLIFRKVK